MSNEYKDFISNFLSLGSSLLLLDAPKRTVYAVLSGLFLYVAYSIVNQIFWVNIKLETYEFIVIALFLMNARTIGSMLTGSHKVAEKYEEQFEVIRRAEKAGLSKAHVKLQLLQICRTALSDATLSDEVNRQLRDIRKDISSTTEKSSL